MKAKLINSRAVILSAIAALLATGCISSAFQKHKQALIESGRADQVVQKKGLALSISLRGDTEVFKKNDPILIDVRLTNITNSLGTPADISVYSEIASDGLLLYIDLYKIDDSRRQIYQTLSQQIDDVQRMERFPHYVRLQPGFFIGRPIQFRGKLKPGIYELSVRYSNNYKDCPVSPGLAPDQIRLLDANGFVNLWRGALRSNGIVFQVLDQV